MSPPRALVSATAAARALGVHAVTVRRWIRLGELRGVELGARYYTTAAAIDALVMRAGADTLAAAAGASGLDGALELELLLASSAPAPSSSAARRSSSARKARR